MSEDTIQSIKNLLAVSFFEKKLDILTLRSVFDNFYVSRAKYQFSPSQVFNIKHLPAFILNNPQNKHKKIGLFLHAGGFTMGSTKSHWDLITILSQTSNIDILSIDYRLAPENPFPAALEDSLSAYNWLLEHDYDPRNILLMGLTAGATLVLAMLLALRELNFAMPRVAIAISPITDFAFQLENFNHNDWLPLERLRGLKAAYIKNKEIYDPMISPFYAELNSLPNILLQVGADEILRSDAVKFYEKARKTDTEITLDIRENLFHCAHQFANTLPEAQSAVAYIGEFIHKTFKN